MAVPINQAYIDIVKAFRKDCDILIRNFREEDNRDVTTFIEIWHSLNFNLVYDKKFSTRGMQYHFMSDSLQIAKLIMLHEDFIGGMFLMYGLYTLQNSCTLNNSMTSIRLEFDEFNYIVRTLRVKDEDTPRTVKKELTFMFSKLLKKNAFDFVAFGREYDIEGQHRAQMIHQNQYTFDEENVKNMKPKDWFQKRFLKIVPKELKDLENDYLKTKNQVKSVFPFLNLGLDMVDESITSTVLKALTQEDNMAGPSQADTSIGARRRALKKRKMKTKHRLQREDREESDPDDPVQTVNKVPPKLKKRRGASRGGRRFFMKQVMNDTGLNTGSHSEDDEEDDSFVFDQKLQNEFNLPDLI